MKRSKDFWSKVDKSGDCWLWQRSKTRDGYGRVQFRGRLHLAHRAVWILTYGEIPEGLNVLHRCDMPACCNPKHLFLGTQLDNNRDRAAKGRNRDQNGEKHPRAILTEKDVLFIRGNPQIPIVKLARKYGVTLTCISYVRSRKNWKHV